MRVAIATAYLLCLPAVCFSSTVTRTVRSTGQAAVIDGDVGTARDQARHSALREAVESGVGVLISSTTHASNYAVIEDEIFTATRGFVRAFDVVHRGRSEDGLTYEMTVDAQVDLHRLEEKISSIDLTHVMAGRPRFVCRGAVFADNGWRWSPEATQQLHAAMRPLGKRLEPASAGEGSMVMDDLRLAETYLAEVLVDARVRYADVEAIVPGSNQTLANLGVASRVATVTLEVRWLDEASALRRWTSSGRGAAISIGEAQIKALGHAVTLMADTLRAVLVEDLRVRAYGERTIQILIEGEHDALAGVEEQWTEAGLLGRLRPHGQVDGQARYEINVAGSAFDLARKMSARGLGSLDVHLLQVSANRIRLRVADPALQTADTQ